MKKYFFVYSLLMLYAILVTSCNSANDQQSNSVKDRYLGNWTQIKGGTKTFNIYEENKGLFLKYSTGKQFPLKYEDEGKYYSLVEGLGNTPLILENDVISINGSKYQKQ